MGLALDVGYASVLTAAAPWLAWRAARTGRYREGWAERLLGRVPRLSDHSSSIWLHGVSLGEVQLLKPLVEYFSSHHPEQQVVLSTSTLTGMQVARKSMPQTSAFYCPLDFSWAVNQAIERIKPKLIVLGELEVWPHLVGLAHRRHIPVAVVNGRLSDRSFRGYRRFGHFVSPTFQKLSLVAAQDETTAQRFIALGVPPDRVHVAGSLKFDNVNADRQHTEVKRRADLVGLTAQHRVLVVGSTQDPEEQAALEAVERLLPRFPELKLIVVPRHPERFGEVDQLLRASPLKVIRRSQLPSLATTPPSNPPSAPLSTPTTDASTAAGSSAAGLSPKVSADDWQVLLVDTVGELKWWWGLAELALVGGSFGSRGGQNMLEPAAYGAKVAFGPNVSNFREIVRVLQQKEAVWQLPTLDALAGWIEDQLTDPRAGQGHTDRAMELIRSHQGATARACTLLEMLLECPSSPATPSPYTPAQ